MAVFDVRNVDKLLVIQGLESEYQMQNYVKLFKNFYLNIQPISFLAESTYPSICCLKY